VDGICLVPGLSSFALGHRDLAKKHGALLLAAENGSLKQVSDLESTIAGVQPNYIAGLHSQQTPYYGYSDINYGFSFHPGYSGIIGLGDR